MSEEIKKGQVVTVATMAGEFIGKFVSDDGAVTLEDPRIIMQTDAQGSLGFASSLCVSGKRDPETVTIKQYIYLTPTNQDVVDEYRRLVSGLTLPPKQGIIT